MTLTVGVDAQQPCAVGGVFADPQPTLIAEQEGGVAQAAGHHRVLAILAQRTDLPGPLFGVKQAPIAATGQALGFGQA